ncbi:MAG: proton-conducting transporter membrane subunit [Candidatus Methanomethylophilaceae archaeon]
MGAISIVCSSELSIAVAFLTMTFLPATAGAVLGLFRDSAVLSKLSMALCAVSATACLFAYPVYILCGDVSVMLPVDSAIGPYGILMDDISALMMSVSSLVYLMIVLHMTGSTHNGSVRYMGAMNALFLACMLCMCADTVAVLVMGWEAVSLLTYLMAPRFDDESPRWRFFVVTHIGGLILLCVYAYMAVSAGSFILSEWSGLSSVMGQTVSSVMIFLLFIGFGSKLGTVPFHAWMPDMYGESPTHTTMILSTVCSNVAVLLLFKGVFGYIGTGFDYNGVALVLLLLSAVSALWGAMESMIQTKPRRILAYSSMENMALVTLCMSMALIFSSASPSLTNLVLVAALFHTINHSVFKSLMLMVVHTVNDCTGEKDISRYGGLGKVMPLFSFISIIGVASMAAVPPMNGFISEWLMLQSMIGGDASETMLKLIMPLTVAVLGVCGMMAATSYIRLYGFSFLGRPRSPGAASPEPVSRIPMVSMSVLALMCVLLGLLALNVTEVIGPGIMAYMGPGAESYKDALSGSFTPLSLGLMLFGTILIIYLAGRLRRPESYDRDTWGCGLELDEDMQYSSSGFTQPLVRVFHPFYGDMTRMDTDEHGNRTIYHVVFVEPFVKNIYRPIGKAVIRMSETVGRMQTGNIQSYLGYILAVLVIALLAVRVL